MSLGEVPLTFFTADTHFGDPRVLRIDRRPFASVADHDAALKRAWNDSVGPNDTVWHLGDVLRPRAGSCADLLASLNGRKHLIVGNNDPAGTVEAEGWDSVQAYAELTLDGQLLILCHYAFRTWNQMGRRSINLHGHSHGRLKPVTRQFDVGVDAQGLRPVTLQEILARAAARTRRMGATSAPTKF